MKTVCLSWLLHCYSKEWHIIFLKTCLLTPLSFLSINSWSKPCNRLQSSEGILSFDAGGGGVNLAFFCHVFSVNTGVPISFQLKGRGWIWVQSGWCQAFSLNVCLFYYRHVSEKWKEGGTKAGVGKKNSKEWWGELKRIWGQWGRKTGEERLTLQVSTAEPCWAAHQLTWEHFSF